jgi:hypothetical protein
MNQTYKTPPQCSVRSGSGWSWGKSRFLSDAGTCVKRNPIKNDAGACVKEHA